MSISRDLWSTESFIAWLDRELARYERMVSTIECATCGARGQSALHAHWFPVDAEVVK